jgi:copper transport protein
MRILDTARRWSRLVIAASLLALLALAAIGAERAEAHAFLESSDPPANAVLPDTPSVVRIRFTEPLERVASTKAALYDQVGQLAPGTNVTYDDSDKHVMLVHLPDRLENGTYSVVWQTLSAADGHRAQGYIPFTIGTVDDVRSVIPPMIGGNAGPPVWLQTVARWISYVGVAIVIGAWPIWLLVLRPSFSPVWQAGPRLTRRVRKLGYIGVGIALAGSLLALYVQSDASNDSASLPSALWTTVSDTRYGRFWLFRVVLVMAAGVAMMGAAWWRPRNQRATTYGLLGICALLPLPFAFVSHASAQTEGRSVAIAVDMLHLLAASIWVGGLVMLIGGLVPALRDLTPAGRRVVLPRVTPRFSAVALASWAVILLTGVYAGWLQVGSLKGLRDTAYGTSLTIKLLLIVPLLIAAAVNLLVISRRVKRISTDGETARWSRRFTAAVAVEVVLVVAVLLVAGRLTTQAPARETLAQEENQIDIAFDLQGRPATLSLAPGKPGPNHYRLEVGGEALPADTEALLRVKLRTVAAAGENELTLPRVGGNAFETHGSEIAFAGDWTVQVIVRQIGGFQYTASLTLPISDVSGSGEAKPAWKFTTGGIIGLVMIAIGFAAIAYGWWAGRSPLRKEGLGIGTVAIALGALLLLQARITTAGTAVDYRTTNPIPANAASVQRGSELYQANCVQCHGAAGRGDGPLAASFTPPAADFTTAHAKLHLDGEFFNWIKFGKPPTAMPAFGDEFTDDQIWDIINYLRDLQEKSDAPVASPVASPVAGS